MNALDYVILLVLCVGFIAGFAKGVIRQAFGLGGLILGIVLGTFLYKPFARLLQEVLSLSDQTAYIVAFVVILLVVPLVCGLIGKLLSKIVHAASLGFLDRILGALFGTFKYLLIMGLVIKLLDITGVSEEIIRNDGKKESRLYVPVSDISGFCLQWTWNKVQETAGDLIPEFPKSDKPTRDENKKV